ncbi:hypothetical protein IP81_14670 [Novosphingobium sp. AAP83]|uniref:PepSY-associated TM helix domain-containing protein n=1 Tax=Novosphingobium sp. AAP83 TaxID=1523425 RepID=UPI0006CC649D|nr:hypothetical protein IP81_14670 [Novosphingobium sp. AAP83]
MRRQSFLKWHRWMALLFAPLLVLQTLTGSVLLFREPLGRLLEVTTSNGPALGIDRLYAAAAATGKRVERLQPPAQHGRMALAQFVDADRMRSFAMIDPVSARIVREGGLASFPIEAALQLHYRLMAGTTGLVIVALNGLVLLLMAGTGLAFWWPGKGRWGKSLVVNSRMPSRIRLRHWHRSFGVVTALLLACSALTGVLLAGADLLPALVSALPKPVSEVEPVRPIAANVAAGLVLAQAQFPGAKVRDLRFSADARMDVNLLAPERNSLAVHVVKVDLTASRLITAKSAQDNSALWMTVLPYHSGDEFGLLGQLVLLVEALVLIGLGVSGPLMWWRQRTLR